MIIFNHLKRCRAKERRGEFAHHQSMHYRLVEWSCCAFVEVEETKARRATSLHNVQLSAKQCIFDV